MSYYWRVFGSTESWPTANRFDLGAESRASLSESLCVWSPCLLYHIRLGGSIVRVKNVNPEFLLAWLTTVVTSPSNALTETECLKCDLSVNQEAAGFCPACGGSGVIVGPHEYANVESGCWCPRCEAGRRLLERIVGIIARARAEDRPARMLRSSVYQCHEREAQRYAKDAN